jgi:hypothetical protein
LRATATYHANYLWVYAFGYHASLGGDIFEHLMKRLRLDLLSLQLRTGVVKVENDAALVQLL